MAQSFQHLVEVVKIPGLHASFAISKVSLPPGALLATLKFPPLTLAPKAYSSVQISKSQHVELNCEFLYMDHSCDPSVELHIKGPQKENPSATMSPSAKIDPKATKSPKSYGNPGRDYLPSIEVRVAARRDSEGNIVGISKGDKLTFFYPSTEWEMAEPFQCNCRAATCRRWIAGARDMKTKGIDRFFLAQHIEDLLRESEINEAKMQPLRQHL